MLSTGVATACVASGVNLAPSTRCGTNFPWESPIDLLPPEILIQIFTLFGERPPSAATGSFYSDSPSFSSPLLLGKICGRWRELAWSTPSLWSYVDLVLPFCNTAAFSDLLRDWLHRSKNLPLTIIFRRDEIGAIGAVRNWGEQTLPLFHLIANEYHRWERIDLFIPHSFCALRMNNICDRLPSLRSAVLRGVSGGAVGHNYTFLRNCPKLEELTVHLPQFQPPSAPYTQLTRLTVSEMSMCTVILILAQTPNLQTLFLADISPATGGVVSLHSAPDTIALQNLNSLAISNVRAAANLLSGVQAPQLRNFRLDGDRAPLDSRSIEPFIEKHGPLLQSLTVIGIGKECISALLAYVPSLNELNVVVTGIKQPTAFLTSLAERLEGDLPELRRFCLSGLCEPFDPLLHSVKHSWVQEYPSRSDTLSVFDVPMLLGKSAKAVRFSKIPKSCST